MTDATIGLVILTFGLTLMVLGWATWLNVRAAGEYRARTALVQFQRLTVLTSTVRYAQTVKLRFPQTRAAESSSMPRATLLDWLARAWPSEMIRFELILLASAIAGLVISRSATEVPALDFAGGLSIVLIVVVVAAQLVIQLQFWSLRRNLHELNDAVGSGEFEKLSQRGWFGWLGVGRLAAPISDDANRVDAEVRTRRGSDSR